MRILHHYWLSSGSRFCRLMLGEYKLDMLLKLEAYWERPASLTYLNPASTVPVITEDDGTVLVGIWPIIEYMEEVGAGQTLLLGAPIPNAEARRLTDWFAVKVEREVIAPLLNEKLIRRLTGDGQISSQNIRAATANLAAHLEYISHLAETRKWLAGDKMSIADLHAAASLSVIDYLGDIHWQDWPEAKIWYAKIKSRPTFRSLLADNIKGLNPPAHYADLDF